MTQIYLPDSFSEEFSKVSDYRDLIHASSTLALDRTHCKRAIYLKRTEVSDVDSWRISTLSIMDVGYVVLDGLVRTDLVGDASLESTLSRILESPAIDRILIDCVVNKYMSQYLVYTNHADFLD